MTCKAALLLVFVLLGAPAFAATDKPYPQLTTKDLAPTKPEKGQPSALTLQECQGLGGKTLVADNCSSGYRCFTTDRYGVIRHMCIDKK